MSGAREAAGQSAQRPLLLAYSPCPNDTFIFHAWVHGLVAGAPAVEERLEDIDTLNRLALQGEADVVKVSMYAFARLRDQYALLHSGGAMGRGCGPLVVAPKNSRLCRGADVPPGDGAGRRTGAGPGGRPRRAHHRGAAGGPLRRRSGSPGGDALRPDHVRGRRGRGRRRGDHPRGAVHLRVLRAPAP